MHEEIWWYHCAKLNETVTVSETVVSYSETGGLQADNSECAPLKDSENHEVSSGNSSMLFPLFWSFTLLKNCQSSPVF